MCCSLHTCAWLDIWKSFQQGLLNFISFVHCCIKHFLLKLEEFENGIIILTFRIHSFKMFYVLISLNRTRFFVNSSGCLKMYMLPALQEDSGLPKLKFCGAANSSSWYSLSCVATKSFTTVWRHSVLCELYFLEIMEVVNSELTITLRYWVRVFSLVCYFYLSYRIYSFLCHWIVALPHWYVYPSSRWLFHAPLSSLFIFPKFYMLISLNNPSKINVS